MLPPHCYCGYFFAILYVYIKGKGVTNSKVILLLLFLIVKIGGMSTNKYGMMTKIDVKKLLFFHVSVQGNINLGFVPDLNFESQ